jgi:hypothetical protein
MILHREDSVVVGAVDCRVMLMPGESETHTSRSPCPTSLNILLLLNRQEMKVEGGTEEEIIDGERIARFQQHGTIISKD